MSKAPYWIITFFLTVALLAVIPFETSAGSCFHFQKLPVDSVKKDLPALKAPKVPKVKAPKLPEVKAPKISADSAKKKAATLKTPVDSLKAKVGLLKKLLNFFKFTKNSRAKEKQRIIFLIDSLVLQNPNLVTVKNIQDLKLQLTDTTRKQYSELVSRINALQATMEASKDTTDKEAEHEKNINAVIAKVVPMLKSVQNTQSLNIDRQKRIQKLRDLYGQPPDKTDTMKLNDSVSLIYKLQLKHRQDILGYISYQSEQGGANYNFELLNSISLFAYELNPNTGFVRDLNNSNTDAVFTQAVKKGNSVYLSFFANGNLTSFLNNNTAESNFFASVVKLLKARQVDGINIYFNTMPANLRFRFTNFIQNLYQYCKSNYPNFKLSITVPGFANSDAYNLQDLDAYANQFVMDFTRYGINKAGPIDPISGNQNNNLHSAITRFINKGILSTKFYMCLPYHGAKWTFTPKTPKGSFQGYVPYRDIRARYATSFYNLDTSTVFSTAATAKGIADTVWYDDENTLNKKYELLSLYKLGGIAIFNLGDGDGYSELWDVLADKFLYIDTVKVKKIYYNNHLPNLTFAQKLEVYYFFLDKPCETLFPPKLARWLGVTTLQENEIIYNSLSARMQHVLLILDIVFGLIFIVSCIILIYYIRREGEWWPWKKTFIGFIIVIVHLLLLTAFMSLFMNDNIPWFGGSREDCIDMPFHILISIILFGIIAGMLIMRFLIFPFMRKEDIP